MNIKRSIESLLFISPKPLSLKDLATVLEVKLSEVQREIEELIADYKNNDRGILIIENSKKYQMSSSPESAKIVQKFMQSEVSGELTPASLETLTIIAYRGPIKKKDIEKIRGINCSLILRNLLIRGLIEEVAGEEMEDNIYNVSLDFIKFLGISKLSDLPDYDQFNKSEEIDALLGRLETENIDSQQLKETEEEKDDQVGSNNSESLSDDDPRGNSDGLDNDDDDDFDDDDDLEDELSQE